MYMLYYVIFLKRLHIACLYTDTIRVLYRDIIVNMCRLLSYFYIYELCLVSLVDMLYFLFRRIK